MLWVAGALLGFALVWTAVCFILASTSGWSRLADEYPVGAHGRTPRRVSGGRVGNVTYGGALSLSAQRGGFALSVLLPFRIGHPALFIPWSAVTESNGEFMGQKTTVFRVLTVTDATIELPSDTVKWLKSASPALSGSATWRQ